MILSDTALTATTLNTVDGDTAGDVNASSITTVTGTTAEVAAAYTTKSNDTVSGLGNEALLLTDDPTVVQLKAINDATSGTITLHDSSAALSGTASDILDALNGITGYTGDLTITGTVTVALLHTIATDTSGILSYNTLTDTFANISGASTLRSTATITATVSGDIYNPTDYTPGPHNDGSAIEDGDIFTCITGVMNDATSIVFNAGDKISFDDTLLSCVSSAYTGAFDEKYTILYGSYTSSNDTFTISSSGSDALIYFDSNSSSNFVPNGIVIQNVGYNSLTGSGSIITMN